MNVKDNLKKTAPMKTDQTFIILLAGLLLLCLTTPATAGDVQVSARINQQEIYLGQPFSFIISIKGTDDVIQPDLTNLKDFQVRFLGKSQNSSIQIFNSHKESSKTCELNYQLTTLKNIATIPAITVMADNTPYTTQPIDITTKKPEKNDNFKLEVRLSKPTAYVGEPLLMTTTWLIGQKARGGGFTLPVLSDPRFKTSVREDLLPRDRKHLIQLEIDGKTILAKQYQKKIGTKDFMAITFFHTLIPRSTGTLTLPQGTITVSGLAGYESPQSRRRSVDPFGMSMWGSRQREIYKTFVIPANPVTLDVLPLPMQGKPPGFNGLVGQYTITANASPTIVNVGDPITLNLEISGQAANAVAMPHLNLEHFKISTDQPKHSTDYDTTTFTTTIRAKDEQVQQIPTIPLSFFNVKTGKYETATTTPIPVTVRPTRIITADDALGGHGEIQPKTPEPKTELQQGIRYNYSDIKDNNIPTANRLILWLAILIPPAIFIIIVISKRDVDTSTKQKKKQKKQAIKQLQKNLSTGDAAFEAWLTFLGHELDRPPQTITKQDILPQLKTHPELGKQVQQIFTAGDAMKYGGSNKSLNTQLILDTAEQLHKVLK